MGILDRARELRKQMESNAAEMNDYMAIQYSELFPVWSGSGSAYKNGERVRYSGTLFKVLQDHVSQEDWTPTSAPSLFAEVLIPNPTVTPEWKQPDSTNPYSNGDKVEHNGKTWQSGIDGNVWEPGVYGWTEVV